METNKSFSSIITAIILAAGIIIAGAAVAVGLANVKGAQRMVTVRGLSEREVAADLAVWPVTFTVGGNNLETMQKDITARIETVTRYLADHNIPAADIIVKEPSITDNATNPYINKNESAYDYVARVSVLVRSGNIAAVKSAVSDSLTLMGKGIAVIRDYDAQTQYFFTALNDIKPDMIAEATKNARIAAEQFARDSGSRVGKIKSAAQGLFSIEDAAPGLPERKLVRVVNSVEYILAD